MPGQCMGVVMAFSLGFFREECFLPAKSTSKVSLGGDGHSFRGRPHPQGNQKKSLAELLSICLP
jgi:hypothetical protein